MTRSCRHRYLARPVPPLPRASHTRCRCPTPPPAARQGVNFMEKSVSLRGHEVTFSIWDIGGHKVPKEEASVV